MFHAYMHGKTYDFQVSTRYPSSQNIPKARDLLSIRFQETFHGFFRDFWKVGDQLIIIREVDLGSSFRLAPSFPIGGADLAGHGTENQMTR